MKKQGHMSPIKEQDKSLAINLNKMEIHNLFDREFKITITKMPNESRRTTYEQSEDFSKYI